MTKYMPFNKVIPLMLAYSIITAIGMYHHELWYDEVQHWLMARDSKTLAAIFSTKNYDDHVGLWKILLYFITHFISDQPFALQVFHLLIINTAVFIFLRFAPFNLIAKILILSGYYFVFEYSILCRNYALGILFLFIVCTLLSDPHKNLLKIGLLLILMINTQEFFAFASIGIFLYLLWYHYERKSIGGQFIAFTFLFLAGVIIAAIQLYMEAPYNPAFHSHHSWLTIHNVSFAVHGIDKGFIPFPPLHDPNFWNRHLFEGWNSYIKVATSILFLIFPVWVIITSRKALIFYISSSVLMLLFLTMSQMTGSRYYGMFVIYFLAAIWLAHHEGVNMLYISKGQKSTTITVVAQCIFYIVLFTQCLAGAYVYEQDYTRPFSQAKNTVLFIQNQRLDTLPVEVDGYDTGPALSAYFRHPIYYLDIDTIGSLYMEKVDSIPMKKTSLINELRASQYLPAATDFILISSRTSCDSEINSIPDFHFDKLKSFQNAIIQAENYTIYKVHKIVFY